MGWMKEESGVDSRQRQEFFSLHQNSCMAYHSLPSSAYRRLYHWRFSDLGMNLTVNLVLELKLRRRGAIPPFSLSVHGVAFEHRQNFI
jgi:hypothetical protein